MIVKFTYPVLYLAIVLVLITVLQLKAQNTSKNSVPHVVITDSLNHSLNASAIKFSVRIHHSVYQANSDEVFLTLRNFDRVADNPYQSQVVALLSLKSNKVIWKQNVVGPNNFITDKLIFTQSGNNSNVYDRSTLKKIYTADGIYFWINDTIESGFLKQYYDQRNSTGYGIGLTNNGNFCNLENGEFIFGNKVNLNSAIQDIKMVGDGLFLIASDILYLIDLKTGTFRGYEGKTTFIKPNPVHAEAVLVVLIVAASIAMASKGNGYYLSYTNIGRGYPTNSSLKNHYYNVGSNILINDSTVYHASGENIISLKLDGSVNWKTDLDSEKTSSSFILLHKDKLIQIETGSVLASNGIVKRGSPRIKFFDSQTGKVESVQEIAEPSDFVTDFKITDTVLYILTKLHLVKVNPNSMSVLSTGNLLANANDGTSHFLENSELLLLNDDAKSYRKLVTKDDNRIFIENYSTGIMILNADGNFVEFIRKPRIFYFAYSTDKIQIITNQIFSDIIDMNQNVIMHIPYEGNWTDAGNHLVLNSKKNAMIFEKKEIEGLNLK